MRLTLIFGVVVFSLSGCATQPAPATASGKVEVTYHGVRATCVRDALVNKLVTAGFSLRSQNDYQIVAGKPDNSNSAALLYGSQFNVTPEQRVTIMFVPQTESDALRVVYDFAMVTNPGSGVEKVNTITPNQAVQDQAMKTQETVQAQCAK